MAAVGLVGSLQPRRLWARYNDALLRNPLRTKAVTTMCSYILGDTIAQLSSKQGDLARRASQMDFKRTARMAGFGLLFTGPVGHFVYTWMDRAFMPRYPTALTTIAAKVSFDQLIYTPIVTTTFFIWSGLTTRKNAAQIKSEIEHKLWSTTVTGWTLWTPAMAINMKFVPGHLRLFFINVVSLFWTYILSTMASKQKTTADPETLVLDVNKVYKPVTDPVMRGIVTPIGDAWHEAGEPLHEVVDFAMRVEARVDRCVERAKNALPIDTTPHARVSITAMEAFPGVATEETPPVRRRPRWWLRPWRKVES